MDEQDFDNLDIKESYKKVLESEDANTFLSEGESEQFHNELKKKAKLV